MQLVNIAQNLEFIKLHYEQNMKFIISRSWGWIRTGLTSLHVFTYVRISPYPPPQSHHYFSVHNFCMGMHLSNFIFIFLFLEQQVYEYMKIELPFETSSTAIDIKHVLTCESSLEWILFNRLPYYSLYHHFSNQWRFLRSQFYYRKENNNKKERKKNTKVTNHPQYTIHFFLYVTRSQNWQYLNIR